MVTAAEEIDGMRRRVVVARARLRALLPANADGEPPLDPQTGERWDRLNILGHMAEFPSFWCGQITDALQGSEFGRVPGSTTRMDAVHGGASVGEATLKRNVARGIEDVLKLLRDLTPEDLDRTVVMRGRGEVTLRWALDQLLVRHLEEHCDQLYALTQT